MIKSMTIGLAMTFGLLSGAAHAVTVTIGEATPILIDGSKDAFYVEETATSTGGSYKIYNNTLNLTLLGFGVTNPDPSSVAVIDDGDQYGWVTFNTRTSDFWEAFNLNSSNWDQTTGVGIQDGIYTEYYDDQRSAQDIWGDIGPALGSDGYANFYQIFDASGLLPGENGIDFNFLYATVASSLFGVAADAQGNTYAFYGGVPTTGGGDPVVPLPAGGLLLIGGLAALGAMRRRA